MKKLIIALMITASLFSCKNKDIATNLHGSIKPGKITSKYINDTLNISGSDKEAIALIQQLVFIEYALDYVDHGRAPLHDYWYDSLSVVIDRYYNKKLTKTELKNFYDAVLVCDK